MVGAEALGRRRGFEISGMEGRGWCRSLVVSMERIVSVQSSTCNFSLSHVFWVLCLENLPPFANICGRRELCVDGKHEMCACDTISGLLSCQAYSLILG